MRMELSYQGFHQEVASFTGSAEEGDPVVLCGNGAVSAAAEGQEFIGVCVSKRGNLLGVQLCGAVEAPFSGPAPALGYGVLAAGGGKGVKAAESGQKRLILSVDAAAKTAVFLL